MQNFRLTFFEANTCFVVDVRIIQAENIQHGNQLAALERKKVYQGYYRIHGKGYFKGGLAFRLEKMDK